MQIGKTKVFLRAGQMADLDARRAEVLGSAARIIQRRTRTYYARNQFIAMREATVCIQSSVRGSYWYNLFKNIICFLVFPCQSWEQEKEGRVKLMFSVVYGIRRKEGQGIREINFSSSCFRIKDSSKHRKDYEDKRLVHSFSHHLFLAIPFICLPLFLSKDLVNLNNYCASTYPSSRLICILFWGHDIWM